MKFGRLKKIKKETINWMESMTKTGQQSPIFARVTDRNGMLEIVESVAATAFTGEDLTFRKSYFHLPIHLRSNETILISLTNRRNLLFEENNRLDRFYKEMKEEIDHFVSNDLPTPFKGTDEIF